MRNGIIVVVVTLIVGILIGVYSTQQYKRSVKTVNDLFTGLAYFLEDHEGRFPSSEEEFRSAAFIERLAGGGIRVRAQPESAYRPEAYGEPIDDLGVFRIPWGTDLGVLRIDPRDGVVRNPAGHEVMLLGEGASVYARRWFTLDLLKVRERILDRAAASGPSGD